MVGRDGFEPSTNGLKGCCSFNEINSLGNSCTELVYVLSVTGDGLVHSLLTDP